MSKDAVFSQRRKIDQLNQEAWEARVHDSPKALKLSQQSLALARKIKYKKGIADACRSLGLCYARVSRNEDAIPVLNEALSLFEELNDLEGQALAYEYMSVVKRNRGELGQALELAFKALSISQRLGYKENEAIQHYQVGVTYKYLGNFDKALEALFKSISIHKDNKNRPYQSYPIHMIGTIYFETGDYKKALEYFKEGLRLRQEFKDKLGEAGSLDIMGYTLFKLKRYTQALDHCKKSFAISKKTGDKRSQANALHHLAEIYAHAGDHREAILSSKASRRLRKLIGDKRGEAEVLLFIAGLPGQEQQLMDWISEALVIADEIRSPDIQSKAHHCLYHHYKKEGLFKQANRHLEKHFAIEKKLQKNSVTQKIANLEITRKAEETRKEAEEVMQRNEELTRLNKELEIESALERARAVTMGMKRPEDMLTVCSTISKQLSALGVENIRNVQTAIFYEAKGTYMNYEYYTRHDKTFVTETSYTNHKIHKAFAARMLKGKGELFVTHIKGDKVKDWIAYQKTTNVFIDKHLETAGSLNYYWHSLGSVALGISTYSPLTENDRGLFSRFLKVFDLAYRRYLDIEKAETQAREAQIEASLERVRSAAMSMQRSADSIRVCEAMFNELKHLGFDNIRNAQLSIRNIKDGSYFVSEYSDQVRLSVTEVPVDSSPVLKSIYTKLERSKEAFYQEEIKGKEFLQWRKWRQSLDVPTDTRILKARSVWFHLYSIGSGYIGISTFNAITQEQGETLRRFRNVFELAYRRYMDVAHAETQAREAQIETGLERVRSKTMAMHRSEEVTGVAVSLCEELTKLGFEGGSTIIIIDKKTGDTEQWTGFSEDKSLKSCSVPFFDHPYHAALLNAWKKGEKNLVYTISGKDKVTLDAHYFTTGYSNFPEADQKWMKAMESVTFTHAFMKYGAIHWGPGHLSEEQKQILYRFSKVFEQSYTRFLDLQKAEAQAREAQIEAALEKVRNSSLAMHNSDELQRVIKVVTDQLTAIGFVYDTANFIVNESMPDWEMWISSPGSGDVPPRIHVSYFDHPLFKERNEAFRNGETFLTAYLDKEEKNYFLNYLFENTIAGKTPDDRKKWILDQPGMGVTTVLMKSISLSVINYQARLYTEQENEVIRRFAHVFEQSYARFLDLQRAEAQAKEAQIEAALERVRSRTMGMLKSDELLDVVTVISDQLQKLNIRFGFVSFGVTSPSGELEFWMASPGFVYPEKLYMPYLDNPITNTVLDAQKKELGFFASLFKAEIFGEWMRVLIDNNPSTQLATRSTQNVLGGPGLARSAVLMKNINVFIGNFAMIPYSDEQNAIFIRFANVFEQSYTRFLDLQKAEIQAKEARIEAALERVRSAATAMHKSEDLKNVVKLVFAGLRSLGLEGIDSVNINIFHEGSKDFDLWLAAPEQDYTHNFRLPYYDHPIANDFFESVANGVTLHAKTYSKELKNRYFEYMFVNSDNKYLPEERKTIVLAGAGYSVSAPIAKYSSLFVNNYSGKLFSDEDNEIFTRFSKVFDQGYTRFLDLKRAEEQAREAQIEMALERVRSRSMAMHNSKEIGDVAAVVSQQLLDLGGQLWTTGFGLCKENSNMDEFWFATPAGVKPHILIPNDVDPVHKKMYEGWKSKLDLYIETKSGRDLEAHYEYLLTVPGFQNAIDELRLSGFQLPTWQRWHAAYFKYGYLLVITQEPYAEEQVLIRFAKVFEQAFTRFLDLKTAEEQAREVQIQMALERVRSAAMAMHKSDELGEVVSVLYKQFEELDFGLYQVLISIYNTKKGIIEWWSRGFGESQLPRCHIIPMIDHPVCHDLLERWEKGIDYYPHYFGGEMKRSWEEYLFTQTDLKNFPEEIKNSMMSLEEVHLSDVFMKYGSLQAAGPEPLPEDKVAILKRFVKVVDLAYRRMIDLQNAEAQAREAKIEASLERVRSKAMAMHQSDDLQAAVAVVFEELDKLDLGVLRVGISVLNKEKRCGHVWLTSIDEGKAVQVSGDESFDIHPLLQGSLEAWIRQEDFYYVLEGEDLTNYYKAVEAAKFKLPESQMFSSGTAYKKQSCYVAVYNAGGLFAFREDDFPEEARSVMKRFAAVFDLTYKRFLDLQKAEAQSREAHIQLALERVRARTMAMQHSGELTDASMVLFQQFAALGETPDRISIGIINEQEGYADVWATDQAGTAVNIRFKVRRDEPTTVSKIWQAWKAGEKSTIVDLVGKDLNDWLNYVRGELGMTIDDSYFHGRRLHQVSFFSQGWLNMITLEPLPPETLELLDRFAAVFNLTYTRFVDLQKAEAQVREAHIQLALERVRARTMAMQQSGELPDAANILFQQMESLEMPAWSAGYCIWDDDRKGITLWMSSAGIIQQPFRAPVTTDPVFISFYEAYKRGESFYVQEMGGEELRSHYEYMLQLPVVGEMLSKFVADGGSLPQYQIFHLVFFSHGFLLFITYEPVSESHEIFKRFGSVFDQTYTRFLDLQRVEAQARESQIEAALERVRAKVIAMNNSNELQEISYVFGDQMRQLKIDWQFSYFWLIEEEKDANTFWITWPDNHTSVTAYSLAETDDYTKECLVVWKEGRKMHSNYLPPENVGHFLDTFKQLAHDAGSSAESVMQLSNFTDGIYLYDGMMKYGSFGLCMNRKATEEENRIQNRFAVEFERAYTRFLELKQAERLAAQAELDLINLKLEKKKTEEALAELQVTQKQLIQSEKMASLGELTAGIAHEIQNPLNFVNNFSEVSNELIDEMLDEVAKGNLDEAKALAEDVKQNLQKINHHGKRADGIVKGMLQHSRSSSGQKELTDINVLADEYLRLSYHGLRAKDKSFNARFEAKLDPSIEKISIVPQDIGRVILNLINNAFYAVNEKKKSGVPGYESTVTVSTKQESGLIYISVEDNGDGIPQTVLDKIFQPFFTTKPTGQGTGLGLSLSYDIIKAHGGELKVQTTEAKGTIFTIIIPRNN